MQRRQSLFNAPDGPGERPLLVLVFGASAILLLLSFALTVCVDAHDSWPGDHAESTNALTPILFSIGLLGVSTTGTVLLYDLAVRTFAVRGSPQISDTWAREAVVTEESGLATARYSTNTQSSYGTVRSSYWSDGLLALEAGWAPVFAIAAKAPSRATSRQATAGSSAVSKISQSSIQLSSNEAETSVEVSELHAAADRG